MNILTATEPDKKSNLDLCGGRQLVGHVNFWRIRLLQFLFAVALAAGPAGAQSSPPQAGSYKPLGRLPTRQFACRIVQSPEQLIFSTDSTSRETVASVPRNIERTNRDQSLPASIFESTGLRLGDRLIPFESLTDLEIIDRAQSLAFDLYTRADTSERGRLRQGNLILARSDIVVDSGRFVRGIVLSVDGDITINGEVNKDIFTCLGDVVIADGAVVRGDVISLFGTVTASDQAVIYGRIADSRAAKAYRRARGVKPGAAFKIDGGFGYNRVDGFLPWGRTTLRFGDSSLPILRLQGGYAFAAERLRVRASLQQRVASAPTTTLQLSAQQWLSGNSEELIGWDENSVLSLVAGSDALDYFEFRGGTLGLTIAPSGQFQTTVQFAAGELSAQKAHRNLWSLFGGNGSFRDNYERDGVTDREAGIARRDSASLRELSFSVEWRSRTAAADPRNAYWQADFSWLVSERAWRASESYRLFSGSLFRQQPLSDQFVFRTRLTAVGGSDDRPLDRTAYLGGVGTLHGYREKAFAGSHAWYWQSELQWWLRSGFIAIAPLYETGKISATSSISDSPLLLDAGCSLYLGPVFKLTAARRLDRGFDRPVRVTARFSVSF